MRGIRTAGAGLGLALAASAGLAQDPSPAPAARLGRIQVLDQPSTPPAQPVVRGQVSDPSRPGVLLPLGGGQPMPGATLGMPRPLPGPTVTEQRSSGAPPSGPAATFGTPMPYGGGVTYGQPIPVGEPIPVGPPVPVGPGGQPLVSTPAAPPVFPGDAPLASPVDLDTPLYGGVWGPLGLLLGPNRWNLEADLLLWWIQSGHTPPLVTTSAPAFNGILGSGNTQTLFGGDFPNNTLHTGGRFGGQYWLDPDHKWALDGYVFFLGRNGNQTVFSSPPLGVLARPFFNVNQGIPFSELVAAPGLATGSVSVNTETSMWGAQINLRRQLICGPRYRLDMFGGFRSITYNEEIGITEAFNAFPGAAAAPAALFGTVTDKFRTSNVFYGGQIGFAGEVRRGRWFMAGRASVALGGTNEMLQVGGGQQIQYAGVPGIIPVGGGLLALPGANVGTFTQSRVTVVPEVGLQIGYHLTPRVRVAVGYNFLFLSSVLRPGDQIDPNLDVTRIPNFPLPGTLTPVAPPRPSVPLRDVSVFAQGITFSLQVAW